MQRIFRPAGAAKSLGMEEDFRGRARWAKDPLDETAAWDSRYGD